MPENCDCFAPPLYSPDEYSIRDANAMTRPFLYCALCLASDPFGAARAAAAHWQSDPVGTSMELTFRHANLIDISALVPAIAGTAVIDDKSAANCSIELSADLGTLLSYSERWPKELRSEDYFDVARTPNLTFVSTRIVRSGANYRATGNLTVHGVTKPATFTMSVAKILPFGERQFRGITLVGTVDWQQFGMARQSDPALRDNPEFGHVFQVKINFELVDHATTEAPAASASPAPPPS